MKILAIGDTHMNTSAICNVAIPVAKKNGCETIVQLGDFGFWIHEERGRRFLNKVSKCLVREGITLYWIDGNHDNHPKLWAEYLPSGPDGFCMIKPNLYYVPRGTVWKFDQVTCLGLGGAFSIDKEFRIQEELIRAGLMRGRFDVHYTEVGIGSDFEHTMWWPTEMIRFEDAELAKKNALEKGLVDIMFTHDCPTGVDVPGIHSDQKWQFPETWQNRDLLREVFDVVQPKLLVHGHYHVRYTGKLPLKPNVLGHLASCAYVGSEGDCDCGFGVWNYCRVDGLSNDGRDGFAVVLDLDEIFPA